MHKITVDEATLNGWRRLEGVTRDERALRHGPLDPARTALIVIDMQNGFCLPGHDGYLPEALSIAPNINRLVGALRKAGGKVVWIQQTYRNDEPRFAIPAWRAALLPKFEEHMVAKLSRGSWGYQMHEDMDVQPGDIRVEKTRWGAFMPNSSELHEVLQANGIDTVIVTGVASDACVETTTREAVMLDYKTIFVMDATATDTDEHHNAAIATLNHIFLPDLVMTDLLVGELERSLLPAAAEG